jgi:DNA-binding IclR family transcriptional regulator
MPAPRSPAPSRRSRLARPAPGARPVDARAPQPAPAGPAFEDTLGDRQFATTLARGLEILRCFSPQDVLLGNKELAERTGLPKPTVSRFTYTLSQLGYLRQPAPQRKYQLGSAVLSLGYPLLAALPLRQLARPMMNALADAIGGSVSMGIRDRLSIVYVETSRSRRPAAPQYSDVGLSHPIAATSIGRAYLAACDPHERAALLNEIKVKAPEQHRLYGESLRQSLDDYRRLGFCICYDYVLPEIYGVGVPLKRRVDGQIVVFNCVVSALSTRRAQMEKDIGPRLAAMAERLESAIAAAQRDGLSTS